MTLKNTKIFSGRANPVLAERIIAQLNMPLGQALVTQFSDGESRVEILENVRGMDVFVIQPTCPPNPAGNVMELLVMIDALKRASAKRITAVIPYFGYSRQDRPITFTRSPITAKQVADMLSAAGTDRIVTIDLHADQIQGFFDIPVDNIFASSLFVEHIQKQNYADLVIVAPDVGGVVRARALAKQLGNVNLTIIDKRRPKPNKLEVMNVIGDVHNKSCIIFDDIVDTAGTLCQAADALMKNGATQVAAYVSHAILSGNALVHLRKSSISSLVATNSIPLSHEAAGIEKISQLCIAPILAEIISCIHKENSISNLFT